MDRGDRLAREMQERVNDGRLRELEGLRHRLNRIADDDDDDYYSDEKMKERFRQEPPDEFVCGVALPKTNGVRWWTPAGCPPWIELLFMGVQWFQTVHKSNCCTARLLNHGLHAIDATPARRRGGVAYPRLIQPARPRYCQEGLGEELSVHPTHD